MWTVMGSWAFAITLGIARVAAAAVFARRWRPVVGLVVGLLFLGYLALLLAPPHIYDSRGEVQCDTSTIDAIHQPELDPAVAAQIGGTNGAANCRAAGRGRFSLVTLGLVTLSAGAVTLSRRTSKRRSDAPTAATSS